MYTQLVIHFSDLYQQLDDFIGDNFAELSRHPKLFFKLRILHLSLINLAKLIELFHEEELS
jgi:chromosome condensin MukBEF MukE localization factor